MKSKTVGMMSFTDIREMVGNAIRAKEGTDYCCYIVDIFTDIVVYESCGKDGVEKYFKRSYSIVDGEVALGEAVEVEKQVDYVPIQASCQIVAAAGGDTTGFKWRVCVARYGVDLNGNYWDKDILTANLAKIEGAKVFALTEAQHQVKSHPFGKSVHDLVGVLQGATAEADGIYATLIILPAASWLRDNLVGCVDMGLENVIGLSVDATGKAAVKKIGSKEHRYLATIATFTVDVVYDPAAGGKIIKMAAARKAGQEEEVMLKKLLAALQGKRLDLHTEITTGMQAGTMTEDQALEKIIAAVVPGGTGDTAALLAGLKELLVDSSSAQYQEMKIMACGMTLDRELTASKLPDSFQATIRKQFEGKEFEASALQETIKATKEALDAFTGSGAVSGAGDVRVHVGRESVDKFQAACDGMFGVPLADNMRDVPVFTSLRAAYVEMTGDSNVDGVLNQAQLRRMQAAFGDATFSYVLGNTLYRRLVNDYREMGDYGVSRIVGNNIRNARDFRTLENVRIGYYGDLPTVDTDTEDYPDLGVVGDEEVSYALQERGGIITINRRMIINDDVRAIQRIISRLPRAARRTVAKKVWTPFLTNAIYKGDNKAIFHADHGNLGSAAYAIASAEAAKTAMFKQTEPGSGEQLGLRPATVAFPSDLRSLVTNVNNFNPQAVAVENGNSMYGFFKPEGLIECPFMTDTNDWLFFADPNEVEIVELAFLNGQQEPTMLVADSPAIGQMFVGGRIQYRINHDFNAEVVDYRGAYKGVVA